MHPRGISKVSFILARASELPNMDQLDQKLTLNSIWLQLTSGWAATPSKHKTFELGMQFDFHRPLHKSLTQLTLLELSP